VKKSTKIVAGASGTGVVLWILHAFHIIHFATKSSSPDFEVKKENAKIILTDSVTGKKDTMLLEDYMKREENSRR
jgi:hypothetical protein